MNGRLALVVTLLAAASCQKPLDLEGDLYFCRSDADCPSGKRCIDRYCGEDECADGTNDCGDN